MEIKTGIPVKAWADKNMISVVVRNLLSNAIKFSPSNGHIVISVQESSNGVEVLVQDSGTGISNETIKKVNANQFYSLNGTNNERGTGLGLALCREFLEKNNGQLMIETAPGSGSTFSFTLPKIK